MALFKKDKHATTNIPELQEYYANQKNESTGKAWLLAIGSLLVTVVVLVAAFFGGRWAYRKITTKKNKSTGATAQIDTTGSTFTTPKPSTSSTSTTTTTPSTTTTTTTPTSTSTTTTTKPAQGVATTQTTTSNTTATAATTAKTVPDTGPGNTIGLFAGVTALAYFVHRRYTLRKLNK